MKKHAFLPALLGLLLLGCLAPGPDEGSGGGGGTSGVGLYVFDQSSKTVLVWKDLSAAFDGAATLTATATLTSGEFTNLDSLAWSGMAFDATRNQLYLVNDNGKVVRVSRARSQTGAISTTDALTFNLDTSNRLTNSKFGQAALDAAANVLYVTENGDNGTRIWAVASPNLRTANEQVSLTALQVSTSGGGGADSGGYGVAAASGAVYGSFTGGGTETVGGFSYTGPRLRKGDSTGFLPGTKVLIGSNTLLGQYAPMGLDTSAGIVYVGVHLASAGVSGGSPVLAFDVSKFSGAPNTAPTGIGDASTLTTLRFLAHAGSKDWLVAGPEAGTSIWIWKQPSASGGTFQSKSMPGAAIARAVALDNNG